MNELNNINWSSFEYSEKEKNNDWFWALGVIIIAGSITSIIFKNYFFAAFIVLSGILIVIFALKKPELVSYELNDKGLKIKERIYPYNKIKSFWVQKETPPTLFIKTERLIMPIISIRIEYSLADEIKQIMFNKKITLEEMREPASDKIMDSVGF